ncbi:hypothetical protein [Siansivirga zeaxanthinifaciens]|uniref:Uncharacterized protein n=1 Tax=Siansivirga zeaxanthinifaciens CC-SAMT-1 TaxID=1454006 RepID=A0A0C5WI43_9FLAO|nr:hypothetical protein [Siansivirga zeaxanthinifaciens]AJR04834.1 hypothetical protein AW14_06800 [Siansivirga zeaxanthinifaciens CC-SAMT-1]
MTKKTGKTERLNISGVSGSYFDNVLIKLKRRYRKDETIAALSKKLSEVEIELGKSIAYIHELEDEKLKKSFKNGGLEWYSKYSKIKEKFDHLQALIKEDSVIAELKKENKNLHIELRKLKRKQGE